MHALSTPLLPRHSRHKVVGKRVVTMFIQPESGTHVSVLWGGNTWNFRAALDEAGVKGAYLEENNEEDQPQQQQNQNSYQSSNGRKYFRVLRSLDISSEEHAKTVQGVLENVFHNLAMKAVVESASPQQDSEVESWIASLKKIDCLHFADDQTEAV